MSNLEKEKKGEEEEEVGEGAGGGGWGCLGMLGRYFLGSGWDAVIGC